MTDSARGPVDTPAALPRSRLGTLLLSGGRTVVAVLSVAVLALSFYGWQILGTAESNLATTNVFDGQDPGAEPLDGAVDILLVGMDSRTDTHGNPLPKEVLEKLHAGVEEGNKQTDTMILVHIPQDGTSAVAFSFPRDSWVDLPGGYGQNRLNSAFRFAYNDAVDTLTAQGETDTDAIEEQAEVEGRKHLIATIEQLVGRPGMIDRYAEVNLASFYEITKAVDGVEVCLREPAKEIKSGIDLPAGKQTIKGVQALAFVRQRHGLNSDLDRINRQQAFLSGLAHKMLSTDTLLDPGRLSDVIGAVQKSVVLSEGWDLLQFANQMRNLSGGNIEFHTIPVVGDINVNGADVLEIDPAQVNGFIDELVPRTQEGDPRMDTVPDEVPGAEAYAVDIYNATGDPSMGEGTRALLSGQGFGGESYATLDAAPTSVIHHAAGEEGGAETLRTALGADVAVEVDPELPPGTLSLQVGTDFALPASGHLEELSRPERVLAPNTVGQEPLQSDTGEDAEGEADTGSEPADEPITAGGVPCVY